MYFPGHELNEKDRLLQRKKDEEQKAMIAEAVKGDVETYRYQIVLEKA
jgi:protocatechuate 3,4-dioxygenase beta subunit